MAQIQQYPQKQKSRPIYYLYAGVMFLMTFSPLLAFGASVFHFAFNVASILPLLLSSLVALPFPILGLGLGLWYGLTQFYHCKKLESFLDQNIKKLRQKNLQQQNQFRDLKNHPELQQFLLTLKDVSESQADHLYRKYRRLGLKMISEDEFYELYDVMRKPDDATLEKRLTSWVVNRVKGQAGWNVKKPKSAKPWLSEKIVVPLRTFIGFSLLAFSLITVFASLTLSILAMIPASPVILPVAFTVLLSLAGSFGLMASLTMGALQKKMIHKQKIIQRLSLRHQRLKLVNQAIQDLQKESTLFNCLNENKDNPDMFSQEANVKLQNKLVVKRQALLDNQQRLQDPRAHRNNKRIQHSAKNRRRMDAAIVFFSTVVPLLGLGAATASIFLSPLLPGFFFPIGVMVAVTVPVVAILHGSWFARSRLMNHRARENEQIRQLQRTQHHSGIAQMLRDPALLVLLSIVKQSNQQQLRAIHQEYKKRGGILFDYDDLDFLREALSNRSNGQGLEVWSEYKVEKDRIQQQLQPEKNILSLTTNFFAEKMMGPIQAAQQMSLLSFSISSMLITSMLGAGLFGVSVSLPVVVGVVVAVSVCATGLGIFAGILAKSIQKHHQGHRRAMNDDKQFQQIREQQQRHLKGLKNHSGLFINIAKKQNLVPDLKKPVSLARSLFTRHKKAPQCFTGGRSTVPAFLVKPVNITGNGKHIVIA